VGEPSAGAVRACLASTYAPLLDLRELVRGRVPRHICFTLLALAQAGLRLRLAHVPLAVSKW
jgi:hypothetical protein